MQRLVTVNVIYFLVPLISSSVAHAQNPALSKTSLRTRVEAEVQEFTRKIPVAPQLREQFGPLATCIHLSGRIAFATLAQAFPVDWFVHSEIVWPLTDAGMVPSYVSGVKPFPAGSDDIVVVLRYGVDHNPRSEVPDAQAGPDLSLDAFKLTGPIFGRKQAEAEPRVLYARDFSSQSKDTTATVVIRCRVREQRTNRICELVAVEEWRFQPTDNRQNRCWKRIETQHHLWPGDDVKKDPVQVIDKQTSPNPRIDAP